MKKLLSLLIALTLALSGFGAMAAGAADGTYTASAEGKDGPVVVETTFEGGKIVSVVVTEQNETPEIAGLPLEQIPPAIVEANAYNVDSVTGATVTSEAIKAAVADAIAQAGGDLADYEQAAAEAVEGETVELTADVVVVGAGAAGVTAALAAQQNGAKTILLEKAASVGGVSIIAGGPLGIDSKDQQEAGVAGTFTIQEVWRDWMDYNCWLCDGTLFYNLFENSGDTVDWLEENGMEFIFIGNEQAAHAEGFPTYHIYKDQENKYGYYQTLVEKFTEAGGELYLQTAGYELEAEDDTITGIKAKQADGTVLDIACKAVCLCTGGFAANEEAVRDEVGFHLEEFSTGTQTGDGAAMSQAIGAGKGKSIQQLHGVTSFSGIRTGSGEDKIAQAIYLANSIWVNVRGSRFCPEDLNYDTALASNSTFAQGEYFYAIISKEMAENLQANGASFYGVDTTVNYEPTIPLFTLDSTIWEGFVDALEDGVEKGIVFKGDTAEALAESMGVDAANLKATIEQYNADCEAGEDKILGKDARYLTSLGDGGYYAVKARPMSLGAIGGVLVNSNLQVIKADGTVINGLYAAGADVAEIYNNSYPLIEGVTLGAAFNGGRMIGSASAEYAK
ncbi:MAG: FAD-dependent oxidoreductase [Clostridia bacterium]|nr:FAD-dependent oxidoreductase [Clostridia bacterium]